MSEAAGSARPPERLTISPSQMQQCYDAAYESLIARTVTSVADAVWIISGFTLCPRRQEAHARVRA